MQFCLNLAHVHCGTITGRPISGPLIRLHFVIGITLSDTFRHPAPVWSLNRRDNILPLLLGRLPFPNSQTLLFKSKF